MKYIRSTKPNNSRRQNMKRKKRLKYEAPKDQNGKPYYVPIVSKNKDVLTGFLDGMWTILSVTDDNRADFSLSLGSDRFNDILPDGRRIEDITQAEFKKHIEGIMDKTREKSALSRKHKGFDPDILDEFYLTIDCECGNFYGFRDAKSIPEKDFDCDLCGKKLLNYTGKNDYDYVYDGDPGNVEAIVQKIQEERSQDEDYDEDDYYDE